MDELKKCHTNLIKNIKEVLNLIKPNLNKETDQNLLVDIMKLQEHYERLLKEEKETDGTTEDK